MDVTPQFIRDTIRFWAPSVMGRCPGACRPRIAEPQVSFSENWLLTTELVDRPDGLMEYLQGLQLVYELVAKAWHTLGVPIIEDAIILNVNQVSDGRDNSGPVFEYKGIVLRSSVLEIVRRYVVRCPHVCLTGTSIKTLLRHSAQYRLLAASVDWNRIDVAMQGTGHPLRHVRSVRLRRPPGQSEVIELHGMVPTRVSWANEPSHHVLRPSSMRVAQASNGRWVEVSRDHTLEDYEANLIRAVERNSEPRRQRRMLDHDLEALIL